MANIFNPVVKSSYDIRDYTIKAETEFPKAFAQITGKTMNNNNAPVIKKEVCVK